MSLGDDYFREQQEITRQKSDEYREVDSARDAHVDRLHARDQADEAARRQASSGGGGWGGVPPTDAAPAYRGGLDAASPAPGPSSRQNPAGAGGPGGGTGAPRSQPLPPAGAGDVLALLVLDAGHLAWGVVWRLGVALCLGAWAGLIAMTVAAGLQKGLFPVAARDRAPSWLPDALVVLALALATGLGSRWAGRGTRQRWRKLRGERGKNQEWPGAGRTGLLLGALVGWGSAAATAFPDPLDRGAVAALWSLGGAGIFCLVDKMRRMEWLSAGSVVAAVFVMGGCGLLLGGGQTLAELGGAVARVVLAPRTPAAR